MSRFKLNGVVPLSFHAEPWHGGEGLGLSAVATEQAGVGR